MNFIRIAVMVLTIIGAGLAMALSDRTLIDGWPVWAGVAILGVATGVALRGRMAGLTTIGNQVVNALAGAVVATSVMAGCFYGLNYFGASGGGHGEKAVVERRYQETRYRQRRIRRNVYGRGEPYKVYFVESRMVSNGMVKTRMVEPGEYVKVRRGDTIVLDVERGLLGVPVVKGRL